MKILRAFIAGVRSFVIPWNQPYIPPVRKPQSIDRYFARIGARLTRTCNRYEKEVISPLLKESFAEAEDMSTGKIPIKRFSSTEDLFKDCLATGGKRVS